VQQFPQHVFPFAVAPPSQTRRYMKKVIQYLEDNERSLSWLARKCDVSPTTAHYWAIGKNSPTNKHKVLIQEVTGIKL
tara:strand:+ start:318 stop:551 length:234 start_codon:yes stop_codon:yes gene_type:complete